MRGRKPKPTSVKIFEGNPGKRRLNLNEPPPVASAPAPPKHLAKDEKSVWRMLTKELMAGGVLTRLDLASLEATAVSLATFRRLRAKVEKTGEVLIKTNQDGQKTAKNNPFFAAFGQAMLWWHRWASEFGMTPASRARLDFPMQPPLGSSACGGDDDFAHLRTPYG